MGTKRRTRSKSSLCTTTVLLLGGLFLGDLGCGYIGVGFDDSGPVSTGGALPSGGQDSSGGRNSSGGSDGSGGSGGSGGFLTFGGGSTSSGGDDMGGMGGLGGEGGASISLYMDCLKQECRCPEGAVCEFACLQSDGHCNIHCTKSTCYIDPVDAAIVAIGCLEATCIVRAGTSPDLKISCNERGATCVSECGDGQSCALLCYDVTNRCLCSNDNCSACHGGAECAAF